MSDHLHEQGNSINPRQTVYQCKHCPRTWTRGEWCAYQQCQNDIAAHGLLDHRARVREVATRLPVVPFEAAELITKEVVSGYLTWQKEEP